MNAKTPDISVVVLCYRSADTIQSFVEPLKASLEGWGPNWELVLVGNYFENSGDRTPKVVQELADTDERIRCVTLVKEGMMGWDMQTGLRAATGDIIAVIDGDGQMPCEDVTRGLKVMQEGNWDLVKAYRERRDDGPYRIFISTIFNMLFKVLFPGLNSRDINSKPKFITRAVYEKMDLRSPGWFIDAEIMIQARRLKCRVGEFPTVFLENEGRPSFIKLRSLVEFMGNLLQYRLAEFKYWFVKPDSPSDR